MKDAAELVKQYAMVNVQQYQIVATGSTVAECEKNYLAMMRSGGIAGADGTLTGQEEVSGVIGELRAAVMDGNTVVFIRLEGGTVYYTISAADCPAAVILDVGDRVDIAYTSGEGELLSAHSVTKR